MKSVFVHGTPEAYALLFGIFFLIALAAYYIGCRFFFFEFCETLKEEYPDSYWLIHMLLFVLWCIALFMLLGNIF
jgi:hypothetical protein